MPLTFTLDTNCVIAVDESRLEATFVRDLVDAHRTGVASVSLVAISASERQQTGGHIDNFSAFKERVVKLGFGELDLLEPMMYWDITFWDFSLWCDEPMEGLERSIQQVLFPNIECSWTDYCAASDPISDRFSEKWRNAKCDVQCFWSHAYRHRDVFVTSDRNFHAKSKRSKLIALAGGRIETPESAARLLTEARGDV